MNWLVTGQSRKADPIKCNSPGPFGRMSQRRGRGFCTKESESCQTGERARVWGKKEATWVIPWGKWAQMASPVRLAILPPNALGPTKLALAIYCCRQNLSMTTRSKRRETHAHYYNPNIKMRKLLVQLYPKGFHQSNRNAKREGREWISPDLTARC